MSEYGKMVAKWCGPGNNDRLPPAVFVADLRLYDPLLVVRWANTAGRWQIAREDQHDNGNGDFLRHLFMVTEDDGSYRGLDRRVFERLDAMDTSKRDWYLRYREEQEARRTAVKSDQKDYIRGLAREVAHYVKSRPSHAQVV